MGLLTKTYSRKKIDSLIVKLLKSQKFIMTAKTQAANLNIGYISNDFRAARTRKRARRAYAPQPKEMRLV